MDEAFNKVIETINSCETREHLETSKRLMFLVMLKTLGEDGNI